MRKMIIPAGMEISDFERENNVRFLRGEVTEKGTDADVVDVSGGFFVNVWDWTGTIVQIVDAGDRNADVYITCDEYEYDEKVYEMLVDNVVYSDSHSGMNVSGIYYPTSEKSVELFTRLMKTVKPRKWFTPQEAAELTDTPRATIYFLLKNGTIDGRRTESGFRWLVSRKGIDQLKGPRKLRMTDRQRKIVEARKAGKSLAEIAEEYKKERRYYISHEQLRQILAQFGVE